MQKIEPGYQILSLFGIVKDKSALDKKLRSHSLLISLTGAFFIILFTALAFNLLLRFLGPAGQTALLANHEENFAFIPGKFISQEISRGYLGNYLK